MGTPDKSRNEKRSGTAGGEAVPPEVAARVNLARLGGRKQDTAEAAPQVYVEEKNSEKVNKTVHAPIFVGITQVFHQPRSCA
jgi:hypothetical protein